MKINLGDYIRDPLTGGEGTVVGRTEWLHGCVRLVVQPNGLKDNAPCETFNVDEPQVERLPKKAAERGEGGPAGPRDDPARHPDPTR